METLQKREMRELDHRLGDGFEVTLLWAEDDGSLKVVVDDWRTDEHFEIPARAGQRARGLQAPVRVPRP